MQSSTTITTIASALVEAQKEMGNAVKDSINPFFKKHYADINSVREAILPALNKHGISIIQPTCVVDGKNYVETILLHKSGEFISSLTEIISDKVNDAQRHGSGLSYARRYAMASIANIGSEDDDANKATGKTETSSPNKKNKETQPPPFTLPPETATEIGSLIETSTLDVNGKVVAANSLLNAKNQAEVEKIKTRLLKLQTL